MNSFKDINGKEWMVKIDGPKITEVRKRLGVDLAAFDGSASERMVNDIPLMIDVMWIVCRAQAQAANVTDVQFGEALVGDPIEFATDALIDAINDFFPKRRGETLKALAIQQKEVREAGMTDALELLTDPETKARMRTAMRQQATAEIEKLLTQPSAATSTPAPSVSAPTG